LVDTVLFSTASVFLSNEEPEVSSLAPIAAVMLLCGAGSEALQ